MSTKREWIAFTLIFGYASAIVQKTLERFGTPSEFFEYAKENLPKLKAEYPRHKEKLEYLNETFEKAESIIEKCSKNGIGIVTPDDDEYPERLKNIYNPPCALYYKGDISILSGNTIAVVGTRSPSPYGEKVTKDFVAAFVQAGMTVISGLAKGIDAVCHSETLKLGGRTAAVLGNGFDYEYPSENHTLYRLIVENGGLIITEFPPYERPVSYHFPIRNRIISGLSMGVLVTEGTRRSGSIITAGHAVSQNREVFAVPGDIYSPLSQASNWLISQGAVIAASPKDIFSQFPYIEFSGGDIKFTENKNPKINEKAAGISAKKEDKPIKEKPSEQMEILDIPSYLNENQSKLYALLSHEPITADELSEKSGIPIHKVLAALTQLELFGLAEAKAGRTFVINKN